MDRNNYYHFNYFPLVFEILGKFLGPMNILLILGSATENIVVIKRHDVGPFQKFTSLQLKLFAGVYHKYAKRQCYISF